MSRPSDKLPVLVSTRAVQRLQAIQRQHKPDQPDSALDKLAGAVMHTSDSALAEFELRPAVLNEPLGEAYPNDKSQLSWDPERDRHSELGVTCTTLCKLHLVHGSIVEVHFVQVAASIYFCGAFADTQHMYIAGFCA